MQIFKKTMLFFAAVLPLFLMAQAGKPIPPFSDTPSHFNPENFQTRVDFSAGVPRANRTFPSMTPYVKADLSTRTGGENALLKVIAKDKGLPIFITGKLKNGQQFLPLATQSFTYLAAAKTLMKIDHPAAEFVLLKEERDDLGQTHLRLQQYYEGLAIFGSQIILHTDASNRIQSLNGRYFSTPKLATIIPTLSTPTAQEVATNDLNTFTQIKTLSDYEKQFVAGENGHAELIIYHLNMDADNPRLCWKVKMIPNLLENWDYFIDAQTGEILNKINNSCTFYPDALREKAGVSKEEELIKAHKGHAHATFFSGTTATATDLKGISRSINVYQEGSTFYMVDVGQDMSAGNTQSLDNLSGAIITADAQNTNPSNDNFNAIHVTSGNNSWNHPRAVSAHYNAAVSYEYFRGIHGRNSINNQGGNITAFVNVADSDGSSMDNAFWNGAAMFYGNGNNAFNNPLQKSLDTGGHEMTHGVVGTSAGLIYQGQSGALNESFADVFGIMISPENWQLGEDIVNSSIFTSGALRDLSNPNQGGSGLNHAGWQPGHMNEYENLPNTAQGDNGGVHVNSGIPNHAFYLLAQNIGSSDARRIYYRALTVYLTNQSQFIDCRIAVLQAASDIFGGGSAQKNAAASAFDQVGIFGSEGSGNGGEIEVNPGSDFVLMTDESFGSLYLFGGTDVPEISSTDILSRPSITDDGSIIVFVADDNTIKVMVFNESTGQYDEDFLEANPQSIWRNIAISKDGAKLAILTTDNDNQVFIFDFDSQNGQYIEILNPTSQQGVFTSDIQYADFIEWDYTGEFLLYDAYNVLDDDFGNTVDYWDIGMIKVWDNASNNFGDGFVFKLFNGLPDNTSVGNPTFSKNSPNIIALDFIGDAENFSDFELLAVDTETGDVGTIYENDVLSYPNYSVQDDQMVFDALDNAGAAVLATIDLGFDKISPSGNPSVFITGGQRGVWFALGERDLSTDTEDIENPSLSIQVSPNPFMDIVKINVNMQQSSEVFIEVFDLTGKSMFSSIENFSQGQQQFELNLSSLPAASYFIKIKNKDEMGIVRVLKTK